jgi:pimeloyl-ACP methyl ester carboxylesterase
MEFSIVPYENNSPMKPWPLLAGKAFSLKDGARPKESLFFFDSLPSDSLRATATIVLIHGLGDEADSWRHIIPLLNSSGFRVLAPDLPGFGRSVAQRKISLKNHAAAIIKLLEVIAQQDSGATGSSSGNHVFLAGNSMGAVIAEMVALKKPKLVHGLILIDGSIPGGPSNPGFLALAKMFFNRKWYKSYRNDSKRAWDSLCPYYANLEALPQSDKEFLKQRVMDRVICHTQEQAFFATQRSLIRAYLIATSRFAKGIRRYKGKILLIWGELDRIIPLSSTDTFRLLRDDIKLEIIKGAGHLPQQENPVETARLIADFAANYSFFC